MGGVVLRLLMAGAVLLGTLAPVLAVEPDEMLSNPQLEARARQISEGLRCLVCQNQSIDDSNAPLAHDLRVLVRDRLKVGDTNAQVVDFVVDRYGEFVLLKPRFEAHTWLLWLATPLLLIGGAIAIFLNARRRRTAAVGADRLSEDEQRRLDDLLQRDA